MIASGCLLAAGLSACGGAGAGDLEGATTDPMTIFDEAVGRFEQAPLAHLPTPFEEMPTLAAELGGPRLFVKRDDQTGLAFGGNKARKLDFILADAVAKGSDSVITWAGVQSNWARMTAAGSRRRSAGLSHGLELRVHVDPDGVAASRRDRRWAAHQRQHQCLGQCDD